MSDQNEHAIKPAEVKPLVGLLHYQEGAIVSRVLLKNKGGNVTLFAFSKGEGLSEHTAPFDALAGAVEGEADILIDGENYHLRDGDIILLPANRPHAVKATSNFKMLLIMLRAD